MTTPQLSLPTPLPKRVIDAARKAMAAGGCPHLADSPSWREMARGWMEKYRKQAARWPDDERQRLADTRDWLERVHGNGPSRREWIRIAMIEQALSEVEEG